MLPYDEQPWEPDRLFLTVPPGVLEVMDKNGWFDEDQPEVTQSASAERSAAAAASQLRTALPATDVPPA